MNNLIWSFFAQFTMNAFSTKFSSTVSNLFTSFCNTLLKPKVTKTLPFQCQCNYTKEYVDELLWYKNYHNDINLLFITMYVGFLSGSIFLFIKTYNDTRNDSDLRNDTNNEIDKELDIKVKINNILNDIDIMNTIPEEPEQVDEFEEIPLNEPLPKRRKLTPVNQSEDYIKL